ncbi:MAG: DUF1059 domain-containing protein [Chloroflexota bacterium]|nr:MAG: DUF1059 domain-containing protein [Chloroflexota bacterium]
MPRRRAARDIDPRNRRSPMKEVTCLCGWQCRGREDEVVEQVIAHGREVHGVESSREEILTIAVDVAASAASADVRPA